MVSDDIPGTVNVFNLKNSVFNGKLLAIPLILLAALLIAAPAAGQDSDLAQIELSARAGFDGYYKGEYWVPVQVEISNDGPDIEGYITLEMSSAIGDDGVIYRNPISLPSQSNKRQMLFVYVPPFATGIVTEQPGRLEYLENVSGGRSEATVAYLSPADLPEIAAAWNALDVIVIHGMDSGQLTAAQRQALESWVDVGGQLVVSGGPAWQETTAGLTDLLPVDIGGTQLQDDIPSLRQLSGSSFRDPGPYVVTNSGLRSGESLIHEDGLPLLARKEQGRGSVFFLALDPLLAPLLDWDGSVAVWSSVADFAQPLPYWAKGPRDSYAAASAVSSLPAVSLPSPWILLTFLLIYIAVVGPLNYLILRRLGRRELAWVTIPGMVVVFSVTAYLLGFQLKGNETIVNQMSIAFGQLGGDQVRTQTLIGLYSPQRATFDLILPQEAIARPFEQGYGDLVGPGNIGAVERANEVTVSDIRVDVGGVETLVADSYQSGPNITGAVRLRSEASDLIMDIDLFNNGSALLENAAIVFGSTVMSLGDIEPGGRVERSERVTTAQSSTGGSMSGGSSVPSPVLGSPLSSNMATILGSTDYYNDREVYPRWQLLQALAPEYDASGGYYPLGKATLITWSDQPQLELSLSNDDFTATATTLYFLELPVNQDVAVSNTRTVLPRPLLSWQVLAEEGVYDARVDDLHLPPGWIEIEFVPYAEFQALSVEDLSIVLQASAGQPGQRLPQVQVWNWVEAVWQMPADLDWGRITLDDPLDFVGPRNAVRIRLNNEGPDGINIRQLYPELTGRLE